MKREIRYGLGLLLAAVLLLGLLPTDPVPIEAPQNPDKLQPGKLPVWALIVMIAEAVAVVSLVAALIGFVLKFKKIK